MTHKEMEQDKSMQLIGYAAALGDLIRMTHIDDHQAQDAIKEVGLDKGALQKAGVESYDLDAIYP